MSAAAARRKKQLQKRSKDKTAETTTDPVQLRLDSLINDPSLTEEPVAYEALQLAQSSVRRNVKLGKFAEAVEVAFVTSEALLVKSGRVSVSSQQLAVLVNVLSETHTACTDHWVERIAKLDAAHRTALEGDDKMDPAERARLQRLHLQFLRKSLKWSSDLGTIRHGAMGMHALLGDQCWRMSCDEAVVSANANETKEAGEDNDEDDEEMAEASRIGLRNEAMTHYALAENISIMLDKLKSLPPPSDEEKEAGHVCPPSQRDALLTRAILVLLAVENLRDATVLASSFLRDVEERSSGELKKSYLDKTDGIAPNHITFVCMLLRICEKDTKTAPLFTWLVRNFGSELGTMYQPEVIKSYTTKIGRLYFDIQPPPNMMDMMENMMGAMGGGGGMGAGAGGAGGMNPGMMQAAMAAMQQGR